jgi:hypothetical protein
MPGINPRPLGSPRRRHGWRLSFWLRPRDVAEWTYAVVDTSYPAVKLGKSAGHPSVRMGELQVGNPRPLRLLAYTAHLTEAALHRRLHRDRLRGEWFRLAPQLLALVEREIDWLDAGVLARLRARLPPPCQGERRPTPSGR